MPRQSVVETLLASGAITGVISSPVSITVAAFSEAVVYIKVTAKSGTTPSIAFDIETSHDESDWHKHTDVTTITDPTVTTSHYADAVQLTNLGQFIRINNPDGVGGSSTPSLTCEAIIVLKD